MHPPWDESFLLVSPFFPWVTKTQNRKKLRNRENRLVQWLHKANVALEDHVTVIIIITTTASTFRRKFPLTLSILLFGNKYSKRGKKKQLHKANVLWKTVELLSSLLQQLHLLSDESHLYLPMFFPWVTKAQNSRGSKEQKRKESRLYPSPVIAKVCAAAPWGTAVPLEGHRKIFKKTIVIFLEVRILTPSNFYIDKISKIWNLEKSYY